jgi:DNA gyrase B subunit, carboxyl terminus
MDSKKRTLLRVGLLEDAKKDTEKSVERLMGTKPEARFAFIQERAEFGGDAALDILLSPSSPWQRVVRSRADGRIRASRSRRGESSEGESNRKNDVPYLEISPLEIVSMIVLNNSGADVPAISAQTKSISK